MIQPRAEAFRYRIEESKRLPSSLRLVLLPALVDELVSLLCVMAAELDALKSQSKSGGKDNGG